MSRRRLRSVVVILGVLLPIAVLGCGVSESGETGARTALPVVVTPDPRHFGGKLPDGFTAEDFLPPTATPSPTPTATPVPTATPTPVPNPAVTITLREIGITQSHEVGLLDFLGGPDDITLVIEVRESGRQTAALILPRGFEAGGLPYYASITEPARINEILFQTTEVGNELSISVVAIENDDSRWVALLLPFVNPFAGIAAVIAEAAVGQTLAATDDLVIGRYDARWDASDDWGRGRHEDVGTGDVRLTLDVIITP